MRRITDLKGIAPECKGSVAALGNFDGVHLGHRQIVSNTVQMARALGVPSAVIAFEPHPRRFFQPDAPPFRLSSLKLKARALEALGLDILFALPFDETMATRSADDFVENILGGCLALRHVIVGYDFRFGHARQGDVSLLIEWGKRLRYGVSVVDAVSDAGTDEPVSSSRVRKAIRAGDMDMARALLGRDWALDGTVAAGDKRGRTIGFPTLNIPLRDYIHPASGVYAVRVTVEEGPRRGAYTGVANVGSRPTFDKKDILLEVHLFDASGDFYGAEVIVEFVEFIRPERKFDGLEALKAQIGKDSAEARRILSS